MQRKFIPLLGLFTLLEIACVKPTFLPQVPQEVKQNPITVTTSPKLDNDGAKPINNNKHIRYTQNFGGGGATLGLLLGPIGVASNAAMINSNTEKDVNIINDKFNVDPLAIFNELSGNTELKFTNEANPNNNISPYLYITKINDAGKLAFAACILIESNNSTGKWVARYFYELPVEAEINQKMNTFNMTECKLDLELKNGFSAILKYINSENSESVAMEKEITYISDFVSPRFQIAFKGKIINETEDRVWIRAQQGVFVLLKSRVKIQY